MKSFKFKTAKWSQDMEGTWASFLVDKKDALELTSELKDKQYVCEVKEYREKRSLDANSALWKMLSMMADVLNANKDDLYLEMLSRYGVFTHVVVKPNVVERLKHEWKTVRVLGEVTINGKTGIQLQCYFGSSTYDSKEFATLLDGVISEAKEIGVDFISREEQERMLNEWGK
jgi:hypothetical protein